MHESHESPTQRQVIRPEGRLLVESDGLVTGSEYIGFEAFLRDLLS